MRIQGMLGRYGMLVTVLWLVQAGGALLLKGGTLFLYSPVFVALRHYFPDADLPQDESPLGLVITLTGMLLYALVLALVVCLGRLFSRVKPASSDRSIT